MLLTLLDCSSLQTVPAHTQTAIPLSDHLLPIHTLGKTSASHRHMVSPGRPKPAMRTNDTGTGSYSHTPARPRSSTNNHAVALNHTTTNAKFVARLAHMGQRSLNLLPTAQPAQALWSMTP